MPLDRSFLALLSQTAVLTRYTGEDQWGNDTYAFPENVKCFYADEATSGGGTADEAEGKQEPHPQSTGTIITDSVGIKIKDRILPPSGVLHAVTDVTTFFDESGVDLYQTSTLSREPV